MQLKTHRHAKSVDLSDLRCPHIVIAIIKALTPMETGDVLRVIAADLDAPSNIAAWVNQSDHELLDLYTENGRFCFYVRCGAPPNPISQKDSL